MGLFRRKVPVQLPFVEVPRGPRGGLGGRHFALSGKQEWERSWNKAARRAGHRLPVDRAQIVDRAILRQVPATNGRRIQVELAGVVVGYVPPGELRRVHSIIDELSTGACEVEIWLYRGQRGGWNGRVLI